MKLKLLSLIVILIASIGLHSNLNAATITAVSSGNWSATGTWDGSVVPAYTDSVVVPSGMTVTIDAANYTCHGLYVAGTVILSNTFYVCNINVPTGGKFYSSTTFSANKTLYWGALNTGTVATATYTAQTGDFKITIDGQFGGTVAGTNDGIGIFFGEYASSYTIDGSSTSTNYIGRLIANNSKDQNTPTDMTVNIKQNLFISLSTASIALALRNNKKFLGTRTMTIWPGYTVTNNSNARFHCTSSAPTNDEGNMVYNIYGTLDLATNGPNFDIETSSFAGSTQSVVVNVGNGTDPGTLKLARNILFKRYNTNQTIKMNWNRPNSKIVFGGNGAIAITSQTYNTTSAAYVDDASLFPDSIYQLSYENLATSAALTLPRKVIVTGTLSSYGYGHKLYAGAVIDGTAKSVTLGRLFNYNNNTYVVTGVTGTVTTVSNTTLGGLGTWVKGTSVNDAAGNTYYCDSVGLYVNNLVFPSATSATAEEFTGGPLMVTGNVTSNFAATYTARFSAAAYINGNVSNGAGIMYFAKNSTVGGSLVNNGTITLAGDLVTGDLTNNGTITLGARMLTLNGSISGNNIDASTGYVQYGGTADRTISGFTGNNFNSLRLNTTGTITLGGATTATGLTLTKGKLALGDYDFAPTTISGGSSSAYVITNGTGKLTLTTADATAKTFPVGVSSTSYDPVKVTPTTGTATSVRVSAVLTGSPVLGVKYNSREWDVTPAVASSTELAFTPSVLDATVATRSTSPVIGHYVSGSYENNSAVYDEATKTYTATFDTFSPFVTGANVDVTAINKDRKDFYIIANKGQLIINGLAVGEQLNVYSLNGQIISQQTSTDSQLIINLNRGVYVVKTNTASYKVIL